MIVDVRQNHEPKIRIFVQCVYAAGLLFAAGRRDELLILKQAFKFCANRLKRRVILLTTQCSLEVRTELIQIISHFIFPYILRRRQSRVRAYCRMSKL